jgi:hypothetical protein
MANYTFLDTKTHKEFDISMPISELDEYKAQNPHLQQLIKTAPAIADPTRLGIKKPDSGFRDVLKKVKKAHVRSTVNTW